MAESRSNASARQTACCALALRTTPCAVGKHKPPAQTHGKGRPQKKESMRYRTVHRQTLCSIGRTVAPQTYPHLTRAKRTGRLHGEQPILRSTCVLAGLKSYCTLNDDLQCRAPLQRRMLGAVQAAHANRHSNAADNSTLERHKQKQTANQAYAQRRYANCARIAGMQVVCVAEKFNAGRCAAALQTQRGTGRACAGTAPWMRLSAALPGRKSTGRWLCRAPHTLRRILT